MMLPVAHAFPMDYPLFRHELCEINEAGRIDPFVVVQARIFTILLLRIMVLWAANFLGYRPWN